MNKVAYIIKNSLVAFSVSSLLFHGFFLPHFLTREEVFAHIFILFGYHFKEFSPILVALHFLVRIYLDFDPILFISIVSPVNITEQLVVQVASIVFLFMTLLFGQNRINRAGEIDTIRVKAEHVKSEDRRVQDEFARILSESFNEGQLIEIARLIFIVAGMKDEAAKIQPLAEAKREKEKET